MEKDYKIKMFSITLDCKEPLILAEFYKCLRIKLGLTREKLAEQAGISSKFLYEIEVGSKGFSGKTLGGLANALDVSCDYILLGIDKDVMAVDEHV